MNALQARSRIASLGLAALLLALPACSTLGSGKQRMPKPDAVAQLSDARGADRGRVDIFRDKTALRLEIVARGFAPGTYGMHIHTTGQCTPPDFASAGGHWNPTGAQHGRDNPMGAHHGDLPNLTVEPDTIGRTTVTLADTPLTGANGLLDADGAAFVLHAKADDMKTDPSGNSGARIVCGVITPPPTAQPK